MRKIYKLCDQKAQSFTFVAFYSSAIPFKLYPLGHALPLNLVTYLPSPLAFRTSAFPPLTSPLQSLPFPLNSSPHILALAL